MEITYCEVWSSQLRAPTDTMSAEQARDRDAKGESYCVVLGDPGAPRALLEIVPENDHIRVSFVDGKGRTHTSYNFTKTDGRMFLAKVTIWSYPDSARLKSEANRIENYDFRPDGLAIQTVKEKVPGQSRKATKEERRGVPVTSNWEPIPKFGDWESIARYDRESP